MYETPDDDVSPSAWSNFVPLINSLQGMRVEEAGKIENATYGITVLDADGVFCSSAST